MRTSLVNRRRLAEMQEREVCNKYLYQQVKDFIYFGCISLYFTFIYFMPEIFGSERNANCTMNTALANAMFGWVLVGGQAVIHLVFILGFLCKQTSGSSAILKEYVEKGTIIAGITTVLINTVGWAVWFAWSQVLWTDIDSGDCLEGYNLFDFINWIILLLCTVWSAIIVGLGCLCCICCAPCLIKAYKEYMQHRNDEQSERNGVLDAIVQRKYNAADFKEHTECAICKCDFEEDEDVTPLPCNTAHYFHKACITPWL